VRRRRLHAHRDRVGVAARGNGCVGVTGVRYHNGLDMSFGTRLDKFTLQGIATISVKQCLTLSNRGHFRAHMDSPYMRLQGC
jgi:hypothetical protein